MWLYLKNRVKCNWVSMLGLCAGILFLILFKENICNLSYPNWGYLLFGSVYFDGVDDEITTSYSGVLGSANRTVCAWVKTTDTLGTVIRWGHNSTSRANWNCTIENNLIVVRLNAGFKSFTATNINDGNEHFICWGLDGTTIGDIFAYYDGSPAPEDSVANAGETINTSSSNPVNIAHYSNVWLNGTLEDLVVYGRVLTSTEILDLYKPKLKGQYEKVQPSNIEAYWSMDDGVHGASANGTNNVKDSSGNDNHGSGSGGPLWERATLGYSNSSVGDISPLVAALGSPWYYYAQQANQSRG